MIRKDISIEDLIEKIPESLNYLIKKGIKCIACGESIWGTLENTTKDKGFSDKEIDKLVSDLEALSLKG